MRDQHRPKGELVSEVVALRKQLADLREAMTGRRRVEDAVRRSEEQLRALVDASPVGLCLLRPDGAPVAANLTFARMLGYDSPGELVSVGDVLGVFASREEQVRIAELFRQGEENAADVLFRCKSSEPCRSRVRGAVCGNPDALALVALESVSAASSGDRRPA